MNYAFDGIIAAFAHDDEALIEIRTEVPSAPMMLVKLAHMRLEAERTALALFTDIDFLYSETGVRIRVLIDPSDISTGYVRRLIDQFIECAVRAKIFSKPIKWVNITYRSLSVH